MKIYLFSSASKPIPVMILGFLIAGKRYSLRKVIFVLTIVFGVGLFIFKDQYEEKDGEDPLLGSALVLLSLVFEGLSAVFGDRMRAAAKPTSLNFMHNLFLWNAVYDLVGVIAFGEIPKFIEFVSRHPDIIKYFVTILCAGVIGQMFSTSMLVNFGALSWSLTVTIRKFFSVILSVIIYKNPLSQRQWIAAVLIFGTLFVDSIWNRKVETAEKLETVKIADQTCISENEEKFDQTSKLMVVNENSMGTNKK